MISLVPVTKARRRDAVYSQRAAGDGSGGGGDVLATDAGNGHGVKLGC